MGEGRASIIVVFLKYMRLTVLLRAERLLSQRVMSKIVEHKGRCEFLSYLEDCAEHATSCRAERRLSSLVYATKCAKLFAM